MAENDDVLLTKWLEERDAQAFDELVSRHADAVFGTCWRILRNDSDAEDAAQECFLKLARVETPPRRSLGGWLHTTASRGAIDHLRARKRRRRRDQNLAGRAPHRANGETAWADVQVQVDAAIADLPERLRLVLVGHFIERRTLEEIAAELGVSRQTVSNRITKAIETVRRSLRRKGISASAVLLLGLLAAGPTRAAPVTLLASLGRFAVAGTRAVSAPSAKVLPTLLHTGGLFMAKNLIAISALCIVLLLVSSTAFVVRMGKLAKSSPPSADSGRFLVSPRGAPGDGRPGAPGSPGMATLGRMGLGGQPLHPRSRTAADAGWTISGRVVRTGEPRGAEVGASWVGDQRPAAGAKVFLKPHPRKVSEGEAPPICRRTCGPQGEFSFTGVPGGVWLRIEIDDPTSEYRTLSFRFEEPTDEEHSKDVGDIQVGPGAVLAVELRGTAEEPVRNGTVLVNRTSASTEPNITAAGLSDSRREAVEGPDGGYILRRAFAGPIKVRARAPGHSPADPVELAAFPDEPVVIHLAAGSVIAGRILSTEGRPIEGAEVSAAAGSGDPSRARSDGDGRFVLDDLTGEKHTLTVTAEGFVSVTTESTPGSEELVFELPPEGLLAGKVVDEDGNPVPRARVVLVPLTAGLPSLTATASSRGTFTFRNLEQNSYTLAADRTGFAPAIGETVAVGPGARVVDQVIRLSPGFPASGKVVDAATRKPIGGAKVTIRLAGEGFESIKRSVTSDDSGSFTVDGLAEGGWIISAQAGGRQAPEKPVELAAGETPDLTLNLEDRMDAELALFTGARSDARLVAMGQFYQPSYKLRLTAVESLGQGIALIDSGVNEKIVEAWNPSSGQATASSQGIALEMLKAYNYSVVRATAESAAESTVESPAVSSHQ